MGALSKRFGNRLREARLARGLTQVQLGEAAGLSEEWVRKVERGEGSPAFDKIEALARGCGLDPGEFFKPDAATPHETLVARVADLSAEEADWLAKLISQLVLRPSR